jgi:hypothetical protein
MSNVTFRNFRELRIASATSNCFPLREEYKRSVSTQECALPDAGGPCRARVGCDLYKVSTGALKLRLWDMLRFQEEREDWSKHKLGYRRSRNSPQRTKTAVLIC